MDISSVLLVDDDQNIRRITELVLSRVGQWKVYYAAGGQEALNLLESVKPDVILLDVMMPGMDGPTVFRLIRQIDGFDNIPVVFMTAKVQSREVDEYLNLGAAGVISKPFNPKSLPDEIRAIITSSRSH